MAGTHGATDHDPIGPVDSSIPKTDSHPSVLGSHGLNVVLEAHLVGRLVVGDALGFARVSNGPATRSPSTVT
ncbi:hypothetical protein [Halorhabdus rudnickae]|uniref:hypothetical protein n=1 Tax=Halorhabdus rudnickae TaxID=1775544 RepID=UPI001084744C|nr:hypothetical protein [Halorhabdus rudnickae]